MAKGRFIQRHSLQTRITHDVVVFACIWLCISGLFVFIPALAGMNPALTRGMRISHKIVGAIFILVPLISAISAPGGVKRFFKKYFTKWTPEDWEFLKKFVPYMLNAKKVHMPDQDEVKSGQRFADMMLVVGGLCMAVSGVVLWFGTSVFEAGSGALLAMRFVHDLFFLVLIIFVIAHAFLGGGVFQPYRSDNGMAKLMFGNGQVSESDALYHWGFWAREEIEKGDHIVEHEVDDKGKIID